MSANEMPLWERRFRAPSLSFPAWSKAAPDRMVLLSDESGVWQAYAWDRTTGTRRPVTDEPVGVLYATSSADGSEVIWFSDDTGDESGRWLARPFEGGEPRELLPGAPVGWPDGLTVGPHLAAAVIADREGFAVHVSEDGGPANEIYRHVDRLTIGVGEFEIEGFELGGLSADETLLAVGAAQDGDNIHSEILVLDPRSGEVVAELADGAGFAVFPVAWSPIPGDQRLAIAHERQDLERPGVWDARTGERTDVALDLPGVAYPVDWSADGKALLLTHRFRGRDELYRLDLATGALLEIATETGRTFGARFRPDGSVWYRHSCGHREPRVLDERGDEVVAPVGERAPEGRPYRSWTFRNPPGDTVHGWVVTPEGEGPWPVYMKVHGGPSWLYCDTWQADVQMMVDAGFAVAMVNYRGSTGYGRSWRDFIIGNIGFPEVEDTTAGLDDLVAQGIADPERAVLAGWSWGGYTTLLGLGTRPEKWLAGVAGVPVGDYMESYDDSAPSLQAYDRTLIGGVVHDLPDFVRERSPITYVDRVKAPVLVLIGESDTRCVPKQAFNYVDALRAQGGDVEVYTYAQGHSSYILDEEVLEYAAVLEFLRRRVALP
jgi:dipeptidyl aminopeptidase/acylaminoacyl peptidase